MRSLKAVLLLMMLLSSGAGGALAGNDAVILSVPLTVQAVPNLTSKNVFAIKVSKTIPDKATALYDVVVYIDGRFEADLKNQSLPMEFQRNLRGQGAGPHELRIDVMDPNGQTVRGRKSITVQVQA